MNKLLEIKNIKKNYHTKDGEIEAIKDFSFDIQNGDFIAIVGSSGCGKSTLLSLICNLEKPTAGEINFFSENTEIGYMFQQDVLFPWLTVYENAVLGLKIKKIMTKENLEHVEELLRFYLLDDFRDKFPSSLSGGMRQRLALIRTLAVNPSLLLLDEPFSALDYQTRIKISDDVFRLIKSEKKTAIIVTHDLSEAVSIANKVIVLSKRPSKILNVYDIDLNRSLLPSQKRKEEKFFYYYDKIWNDLNDE